MNAFFVFIICFFQLISTGPLKGDDPFYLTVSADISPSSRIDRGKYDFVNSDIKTENFPILMNVNSDYGVKCKLFHFSYDIHSADVIEKMAKEGYKPARLPELLSFGETKESELWKYLENNSQEHFPIIALGSAFLNKEDKDDKGDPIACVSAISYNVADRILGTEYFDRKWFAGCWFLAVRS